MENLVDIHRRVYRNDEGHIIIPIRNDDYDAGVGWSVWPIQFEAQNKLHPIPRTITATITPATDTTEHTTIIPYNPYNRAVVVVQ